MQKIPAVRVAITRGATPAGRAVHAAAAHPLEGPAPVAATPVVPAMPAVKSVDDHGVNNSGLNGLTVNGTSALDTGTFTVSAVQPIQYTVREVPGLLDPANETLLSGVIPESHPLQLAPGRIPTEDRPKRLVVVDDNVDLHFGDQIRAYFAAHNADAHFLVLPTCEDNKNFDLVFRVAEEIEKVKLNRRKEPLIAIGGGVCLDVCGLAANLYRRNTPIIKVPTTLMGVVDASIGIKTAVNFIGKKNKLGTYCPPLAVFADLSFLRTLDDRNLANGSAEILKMACIKDEKLFHLLEAHATTLMATHYQCDDSSAVIRRAIQGMLEELEYNLHEHILLRLVDYGHTFSMDIEMAGLEFGMLHGEAVSIDMALTTVMARERNLITVEESERVFQIMAAFRLPIWHDVCDDAVLWKKALADIIKTRDGAQRTPLMRGVGAASFINDITEEELLAAVAGLKERAQTHPVSYMHMADHTPADSSNVAVSPLVYEPAHQPSVSAPAVKAPSVGRSPALMS
eukprot:jgi/Ulvmu1/7031/UM033_0090.1